MNSLEIIASIYKGQIPVVLDEKTKFIIELLNFEHSISSSHAILITAARRDNFKDDKVWASWCEDKFGFTASHRCHMVQAGRLLLDVIKKIDIFQFLFKLEPYKLISLERIDRLRLPEFLAANDVAALNRDQVRDAVNNFLGQVEPTKSFPVNPAKAHQPDLFEMIDSVCSLRPEAVIKSITDNDKAWKVCKSGLLMYGSSIEYYKLNPESLPPELIDALEDDLKTLRALVANKAGFKVTKAM